MKSYPSIGREPYGRGPFYVFEKFDGSNIRAEWHRKKGFWKFGSRDVLLDEGHPFLGEAVALIQQQTDQFSNTFIDQRWDRVICFFEFWGRNSFAGLHVNERHHCTLIDVAPHKLGILRPNEFVRIFEGYWIPYLTTVSAVGPDFVSRVPYFDSGHQHLFEGVVCKGIPAKRSHPPLMFKVKTPAWIAAVKARYGHQPVRLEALL